MKYFSIFAERSFFTAPTGERLFSSGFFRSAPYILPDRATEKRLFYKLLWFWRLFLSPLIVSLPILFALMPDILFKPMGGIILVGWLILWISIYYIAFWLVFRHDLRDLPRLATRLPYSFYLRDSARRNSKLVLWLVFLGSLEFVAFGVLLLFLRFYFAPYVWIVGIIVFGLYAIQWGYILYLKYTQPELSD